MKLVCSLKVTEKLDLLSRKNTFHNLFFLSKFCFFLNVIQRILVALVEKVENCIASCDVVCLGEKMGFSSF